MPHKLFELMRTASPAGFDSSNIFAIRKNKVTLSPVMRFIFLLGTVQCMTNVVHINDGLINGNIVDFNGQEVGEYMGIPYAAPPTGNLRFMPPHRPAQWGSAMIDTLERKPLCAQTKEFEGYTSAEDCLFLDVFTPSKSTNYESDKKAVMVWIHGGRVVQGAGFLFSADRSSNRVGKIQNKILPIAAPPSL